MEQISTRSVSLPMPSENRANHRQVYWLLGAGVLLEAFYLRMHSLYYLKNHVIAFIELALAAGVVYLIALYGIERTRSSRAATILLVFAAIAFRATLWPMLPTLSDDLQRYRWDGMVQTLGWNLYAVAPKDPRLIGLWDQHFSVMPAREMPSIYPPASQWVFRATWKLFPGPKEFKV